MTKDPTAMTPSTAPTRGKPLTAKELLTHPAFKSNEWDLPPTQSGYCDVARGRSGGPISLYYEIHGQGPTHIVWIMGLGAFRTAWKRQSKYFGHTHGDQYSCLVLDNRGMGLSGKPFCRYSTTEMAQDIQELLKHVGWVTSEKPSRDLNVAGVSMGGMIAQELGLLIPDHIQSLILISTAPRLVRTVPFVDNLRQRINMFIPKDVDIQLDEAANRMFSREFLEAEDHEHENSEMNFPMVRDRFAASELAKRMDTDGFTRKGFILQAIAAGWHHKTPEQLRDLGDKVGRKRIMVMHGTVDNMITYPHLDLFKTDLGEGPEYKTWENCGHVLLWERETQFNETIQDFIAKTDEMKG